MIAVRTFDGFHLADLRYENERTRALICESCSQGPLSLPAACFNYTNMINRTMSTITVLARRLGRFEARFTDVVTWMTIA